MGKKIIVVGGGIIGLSVAYFLGKEGHEVTILEKSDITSGASFVNAGYLTPSHIIPLASPGMIAMGMKMMFNSASPFYMRPRFDRDFMLWSWYFHKSSTKEKVAKAMPIIKDINLLSRELFESIRQSGDLGDFQLERKGLLMVYKTQKSYEHEAAVAQKAANLGLESRELNKHDLKLIQPTITMDAEGAILYECDGHMTPTEFMPKMVDYLKNNGVTILCNEQVKDFSFKDGTITAIETDKGHYSADEFILAAGSWSSQLTKKLGLKLPLQAGKGYCINVFRETGITMPAILMEAKMAVTPMSGFTRFAGTMEFSGINEIVRKERVEAIARGAKDYYNGFEITKEEKDQAKTGLRPVSPDGLPYIGRPNGVKNLIVATGHAMMGWSLGPATGKLIAEMVTGKSTSLNMAPFQPNRKFR